MKSSKLKLWLGSDALPGNAAAVSDMVDTAIKGGVDTFEAAPEIVAALRNIQERATVSFPAATSTASAAQTQVTGLNSGGPVWA